ncbi:cyclophilin [Tremella mesenterica]|uniref:Cyclophilin n=1 Tax=Tremella mesenterica TaxID=5217 RepID=A0A4Q1BQK7_TREME|nr:cyclophilin [Tremella mesenterica]
MNAQDSIPIAGSSKKSTVYIAGIAPEVNEQQLLEAFVTFGDIIDIKIPTEPHEPNKHRGFAFLTFANPADAQDAIDNYDLNELPGYKGRGKFLKCSIAQPNRYGNEGEGDKFDRPVWESEEWLKKYAKPLDQNGAIDTQPEGQSNPDGEESS